VELSERVEVIFDVTKGTDQKMMMWRFAESFRRSSAADSLPRTLRRAAMKLGLANEVDFA